MINKNYGINIAF